MCAEKQPRPVRLRAALLPTCAEGQSSAGPQTGTYGSARAGAFPHSRAPFNKAVSVPLPPSLPVRSGSGVWRSTKERRQWGERERSSHPWRRAGALCVQARPGSAAGAALRPPRAAPLFARRLTRVRQAGERRARQGAGGARILMHFIQPVAGCSP